MTKKHHLILYALLGCTVLTAALFGADASVRAERTRQTLEAAYTRHALETQEQLQAITVHLAKARIATDLRTRVELLGLISRQAESVAGGLSALPLSHAAMGDTIRFCNQLSEYALGLALMETAGGTPGTEDGQKLAQFRNQCSLLLGQLAVAQPGDLAVPYSVFYEKAAGEERPLERVADPDHGMEYPSMIYDGAFSDARRAGTPKGLNPTQVDQQIVTELDVEGR